MCNINLKLSKTNFMFFRQLKSVERMISDDLGKLVDEIIETHDSVSLLNFYDLANYFMANRSNQKRHPGIIRDKSTGELFMKLTPKLMREYLLTQRYDWVDRQYTGIGQENENFEEGSILPESQVLPERSSKRRSLSPTSRKSPNTSYSASSSCSSGAVQRNQTAFTRKTVVERRSISSPKSDYEDDIQDVEDYNSEQDDLDEFLDENNCKYEETTDTRLTIKQWLFELARAYKTSKDQGIRMTELDKKAHSKFGVKDFDALATEMGFLHGEDAMLHIGHPQLKLAKHKTTGKVCHIVCDTYRMC